MSKNCRCNEIVTMLKYSRGDLPMKDNYKVDFKTKLAMAWKEIKNAEDTSPLVEAESRLGWEPTLEYMTDREHLEWKIRQVKSVIEYDIAKFRKIIDLN